MIFGGVDGLYLWMPTSSDVGAPAGNSAPGRDER
jgi:hypothetical protein